MLFLHRANLVILSQPKTGTSALQRTLGRHASIAFNNPPTYKHVRFRKFEAVVAPLIERMSGLGRSEYEVVSVMREPLDWLGSWYRYRAREALSGGGGKASERFTGTITFEEFLEAACLPPKQRPAYARVGIPCGVAMAGPDKLGVDRLFPYEDMSGLFELVQSNMNKKFKIKTANVSPTPPKPMKISSAVEEKVRKAFAYSFELHASLSRDGRIDPRFKSSRAGRL